MGSSQCCTVNTNDQASELAIGMKETSQSSKGPKRQRDGKKNKNQPLYLFSLNNEKISNGKKKVTHGQFRIDDPQTPVFADNKSIHSKQESEQYSNKDIQLVAEIVMQLDDIHQKIDEENEDIFISQTSLKKKRKNDSPLCEFQPKNSLKSFDSKRLNKLKSISEHKQNKEIINKEELESQRSQSADNRSVKSILKQEMKYSQYKKSQFNNNDIHSQKRVHFQLNK
ncbi:unnamed protein product [Paramecium primaurelia]|uniref:Uncharacterized protein n=1 Tax=Paramecium primaurelia TaxID=5886 RepID=A0A8S1LY23_PARPR|nr:unnamed protein product [Paramecium primaurelia]